MQLLVAQPFIAKLVVEVCSDAITAPHPDGLGAKM
jgi:hypothetical protein